MFVVVILDRTSSFHSDTASLTTEGNSVPSGISELTLLHACSVEIQEIPTREMTSLSLNENSPPTRVAFDVEDATPLVCSTLFPEPVAEYVLLLVAVESK